MPRQHLPADVLTAGVRRLGEAILELLKALRGLSFEVRNVRIRSPSSSNGIPPFRFKRASVSKFLPACYLSWRSFACVSSLSPSVHENLLGPD